MLKLYTFYIKKFSSFSVFLRIVTEHPCRSPNPQVSTDLVESPCCSLLTLPRRKYFFSYTLRLRNKQKLKFPVVVFNRIGGMLESVPFFCCEEKLIRGFCGMKYFFHTSMANFPSSFCLFLSTKLF